ncbi:siphovirus Gp157 family protein [Fusobacterium sp.]|uniref:siphovirus Gp157 family protein n=1 Tax=Fusobacterium sp. TaxID=68766 RepID=UPI002626E5AE|nr:siphovirus Gp157 family protein [Fusobacterium sp.]
MKMYEIAGAMIDTLDIFLESDGTELDKENYDMVMDYLKDELSGKSSNIIKYIRNLELESKSAKEEAARLLEISKKRNKKIENLKNYLVSIMQFLDKKKIETELGNYGLRRSSKVDVYDMNALPKEFLKIKEEIEPNKTAIADYIKQNGEMKGARIVTNYSLQIR